MQSQTVQAPPRPVTLPARVAVVGFGTVGRSVAKILVNRTDGLLRLACVCNRNVARKRVDWVPADVRWTEELDDVLGDDVDVVVELMGGLDPAGDLVRRALGAGKAVVTANKQLIAQQGGELLALASRQNRQLLFEASVAGGLPVVRAIQVGIAGDRLRRVAGILNGTCNYIFTRMESAGLGFGEALAEAQALGFAEADPTADVDGYDAQAKLAILALVGLKRRVRQEDIFCASIRPIESIDFTYARRLDCTIRQIAWAELGGDGDELFAAVRPSLVPLHSPFGKVEGSQNLVQVQGEYGGETALQGLGAGGDPTAVAVVSDLLSVTRSGLMFVGPTLPAGSGDDPSACHPVSTDFTTPHYLRFIVRDQPGIIASLATALARHGINIDAVLQLPGYPHDHLPFVMTLEACRASTLDRALEEIRALPFHVEPPVTAPIIIQAERLGGESEGQP